MSRRWPVPNAGHGPTFQLQLEADEVMADTIVLVDRFLSMIVSAALDI